MRIAPSTPRQRLLETADRLFYADGVCTVGINRIVEEADVARASLYSNFDSKDHLVRAYLEGRSQSWQALLDRLLPSCWGTPREQILGVFELLAERFSRPGYRGCPFINASAEATVEQVVSEVRDAHRRWVRELFLRLSCEAHAENPATLSAQLVLLYDGSMVGAQLDRSAAPGLAARDAAASLLRGAIG